MEDETMKKLLALLLLFAMLLSAPSAAFAADGQQKNPVAAVAIVREEPGLPMVANAYSLRMTRTSNGAACDEELGEVPAENVSYFTTNELDLMPEESRKKFEAHIEQVRQLDPDLVKYLFWIELTGDYAGAVGEQADGSKTELDMWFSDYESQTLYAMENGHDAPLNDSIRNGNYRLTLRETGTVVITTVGVRMTEGVMELITDREVEPKLIWVASPTAGWVEDPTEPARIERYSEFVPVFGQEEYEIKLVVAKEAEEDELITYVPTDDMFIITLDQIEALTPAAQENYIREYERLRDDTEHVVQYFFYIDLTDEYRSLVGVQEDGSVQYLLLSFTGDRDDYTVTSNGNEMEVSPSETEEGTFYIKCSELGALAIMYPAEEEQAAE